MKTEIFVTLEYCELVDGYTGWDYVEKSTCYVFDDYEKARYWVLAWVRDYNKRTKKTIRNETGEFINLDEPVLVETEKDQWESFDVDIRIYKVGEFDIEKIEVTERVYLS